LLHHSEVKQNRAGQTGISNIENVKKCSNISCQHETQDAILGETRDLKVLKLVRALYCTAVLGGAYKIHWNGCNFFGRSHSTYFHPYIFNFIMRWSPLVSIFAVLAVTSIFEGVFGAPLDDVILEGRAKVKPSNAKAKKLTAGSLKKSSATYRKAALRGPTFSKGKGKVSKMTKTKTPKSPPKGKDAGKRYNWPSLSREDDNVFRPYPRGSDSRQGVA